MKVAELKDLLKLEWGIATAMDWAKADGWTIALGVGGVDFQRHRCDPLGALALYRTQVFRWHPMDVESVLCSDDGIPHQQFLSIWLGMDDVDPDTRLVFWTNDDGTEEFQPIDEDYYKLGQRLARLVEKGA